MRPPGSLSRDKAPHAGSIRDDTGSDVVRLKVVLLDIVPPIWRRLRVPMHFTLRQLHAVLQEAIGWRDIHPHRFRAGEASFGRPDAATGELKDSRWIALSELLSAGGTIFTYHCGPEEAWTFQIRLEGIEAGAEQNQRPVCLDGERACPPEGCLGPDDYLERLGTFDPERFDADRVNDRLALLR